MILLLLACADPPGGAPARTPVDDSAAASVLPPAMVPRAALLPGDVVIDRVTVVDADGSRANQAVVLRGGTILEVRAPGRYPRSVTRVDGRGKYLVPGLVDAHVHLAHSGGTIWTGDPLEQNLRATLYHGVTAVYDVGGPDAVLDLRDRVAAGELLGPTILATGPFLTAELSHPCESFPWPDLCVFVTADDAGAAAAARVAAGADGIKIALADASFTPWPTPRLDVDALDDIVAAGLPVLAHVDEDDDVTDAVAAGVSLLAHPPFGGVASTGAVSAAASADAVHTTLSAFAGVIGIVDGTTDLADPGLVLGPGVLANWTWVRAHPEVLEPGWSDGSADWLADAQANLAAIDAAGGTLLPGSDAGYYFVPHGLGLHAELRALVDLGWTEQQVLTAATLTAREVLGLPGGRVEAGAPADLLLLSANPLADVANLDAIDRVVVGGTVYPRATLLTVDLGDPSTELCLDAGDCAAGQACDGVAHACVDGCSPTYSLHGDCDAASWCMPDDGYTSTTGACHEEAGAGCDLYAQDCAPAAYDVACVPYDHDTNGCWYAGPKAAGEACAWDDADEACGAGLFCSWVDGTCYALCDPDAADTCTRPERCVRQYAATGVPWFGVCR